jgi:uncharacterized protein (TIGR03435 family)
MKSIRFCIAVASIAWTAFPQVPPKSLEFEVASIKPAEPDAQDTKLIPAEDLIVKNLPLLDLIAFAYNSAAFQVTGAPGWAGDRYDILAKPPKGQSAASGSEEGIGQSRERLRSLLARRFGLQVHRETREGTVYLLMLAKGGPKLKEITEGDNKQISGSRNRSQGWGATMPMLAGMLSNRTGRKVIDKTGLTARYDWVLEWAPDTEGANAGETGPTIFTALREQLGLKLETSKAPVEVIVVDHLDRPSPN